MVDQACEDFCYQKETCLLQQNDMQTKQQICGVDLTFICKMVLLLLSVYNSVPIHNSLIRWSTGTTRAGWVGLLL